MAACEIEHFAGSAGAEIIEVDEYFINFGCLEEVVLQDDLVEGFHGFVYLESGEA